MKMVIILSLVFCCFPSMANRIDVVKQSQLKVDFYFIHVDREVLVTITNVSSEDYVYMRGHSLQDLSVLVKVKNASNQLVSNNEIMEGGWWTFGFLSSDTKILGDVEDILPPDAKVTIRRSIDEILPGIDYGANGGVPWDVAFRLCLLDDRQKGGFMLYESDWYKIDELTVTSKIQIRD